jgi:predicted Zn finger-like uncharacterized protein
MATLVTCPACQRKLKIAPASVGKPVKCPCGNVFKPPVEEDEPVVAALPVDPEPPAVLIVSCEGCGTKLKVPASAAGRKMKCSKCGTTFEVKAGATPPPTEAPISFFEDEPTEAGSHPAQGPRAEHEEGVTEILDEPPPTPAKPRPTAKPAKEPATAKQPSGCVGCFLSVVVLLIVVVYGAGLTFSYLLDTDRLEVPLPDWWPPTLNFQRPPPEPPRGVPRERPEPPEDAEKGKDKDKDTKKDKDAAKDKDKDAGKDKDKANGKDKDKEAGKDKDKANGKDKDAEKDKDKQGSFETRAGTIRAATVRERLGSRPLTLAALTGRERLSFRSLTLAALKERSPAV